MADEGADHTDMAEHRRPQPHQQAARHQCDQQRRPARHKKLESDTQRQGQQTEHQRRQIDLTQMLEHGAHAFERGGLTRQINAQQIGHLPQRNHHRSAQRETQHHRVRNEIYQCTEAHHPQQQLKYASDEGQQQDQHDVVLTGRDGERTDTGV